MLDSPSCAWDGCVAPVFSGCLRSVCTVAPCVCTCTCVCGDSGIVLCVLAFACGAHTWMWRLLCAVCRVCPCVRACVYASVCVRAARLFACLHVACVLARRAGALALKQRVRVCAGRQRRDGAHAAVEGAR